MNLARTDRRDSRTLLWPFDRVRPIDVPRSVRAVRLRRAAAAIAAGLRDSHNAGGLAAIPAAARVLPYQLEPALAIASGESRVLLADEVGLGKTAEAGWIVADLLAKTADAKVLIATPAGLRAQWQSELASLFDIQVIPVDAPWLRRTIADLPADVNPWSVPGVYLTSIDFLKRRDIAAAIGRHLWDLLVVDEAHTAAAPTDRHRALAAIAAGSRTIVTITATPFSGDQAAFASVAGLGSRSGEPALMFRRSREDVGLASPRRHRFATVRLSPAERRLQRLLERYAREVWRDPSCGPDGRLAVTVLRKRGLSSAAAAARSLKRRGDLLGGRAQIPVQLPLFDDQREVEDEEPSAVLAAPGLADHVREREWLAALADAAQRAAASESKCEYLRRLIRRMRGEPVIVFTEYRDTLRQLAGLHPTALLLHGGMAHGDRAAVQRRFNSGGGVLIATDAAAEGLNLQHRCRTIVNFELPWNPARLEQRIGRVDRIGQQRPVHALTLVARDTAEHLVIANIVRRLRRVATTLGERDRLSAFLDEMKMAAIVIGDTPEVLEEGTPAVARRETADPRRDAEAMRLALRARLRHVRDLPPDGRHIFVTRITARRDLPAGAILLFSWRVSDGAGQPWSRALVPVQIHTDVGAAATAAAARETAKRVLARHRSRAESVLGELTRSWFQNIAETVATIAGRRRERELELAAAAPRVGAFQAGLFDQRAITIAAERRAQEDDRQHEHRARIALLDQANSLQEHLELAAVLLVHAR